MKVLTKVVISMIMASSFLFAQDTWLDNGTFNHQSHFNKMPDEPPAANPTKPDLHPGFDAQIAHPKGRNWRVSGLDYLKDGRMVLGEWALANAKIYLIVGADGDPEKMQITEIATGITNLFGVKVVDGEIYYVERSGLYKLTPTGGNNWGKKLVSAQPVPVRTDLGPGNFPFTNGIAWDGTYFYYAISGYKNYNFPNNDGTVVRVSKATGVSEVYATGVRNSNGMGVNAAGELFITDNQGTWRHSNPIYHITQGVFCGWPRLSQVEGNESGHMTEFTPRPPEESIQHPAIHIPYRFGRSLTDMQLLDKPPFKDQFLIGDITTGRVHRVDLQKVKGVYQGASFLFSGVLEAGIQSFTVGSDGSIYGGGLGLGDKTWAFERRTTAMMKWKRNSKSLNDIHTIHSNSKGFDVVFTEPLTAGAANPENFWAESYHYTFTKSYFGDRQNVTKVKITGVQVSEDRKTVALTLEGLKAGLIYRFAFSPNLKFQNGSSPWHTQAWYTLNVISDATPLNPTSVTGSPAKNPGLAYQIQDNMLMLGLKADGPFQIRVLAPNGRVVAEESGMQARNIQVMLTQPGVYILQATQNNHTHTLRIPHLK